MAGVIVVIVVVKKVPCIVLRPSENPLTRFLISSFSDFMCSLSDSTVSND